MIYDLSILDKYTDEGLLRRAEDKDLVQYNYTEYCNNQGLWDEVTLFNRGNIYEKKTGKLIAKAMPKFMNFSQYSEEEQAHFLNHDIEVYEKKDGCLGILYMYNDEIRCNSRGGFDNYVTDKIKQLLPKYEMLHWLLRHNTMNVEVISPETKIICDYGDEEELYLLTAFNYEHQEHTRDILDIMSAVARMPQPSKEIMTWEELFKWQKTSNWEKEGFVVSIPTRKYGAYQRAKIKSEDYMKVVSFKAHLNKHTLWDNMRIDMEQNTSFLSEYEDKMPDELVQLYKQYKAELEQALEDRRAEAQAVFEEVKDIPTRELHSYFVEHPTVFMPAVYNMRNGKPIDRVLIKMIEPKTGTIVEDFDDKEDRES